LLVLGLIVTVAFAFWGAQARVQAEVGSSLRLGRILVGAELLDVAQSSDPQRAFAELGAKLPRIRHIRFAVVSADNQPFPSPPDSARADEGRPPRWFTSLFDPALVVESIPAQAAGSPLGRVEITSHPQDEIGEIWGELTYQTALLLTVAVIIAGLSFLTVTVALRPLSALARGFDRLERGDFTARLGPIRVSELSRIGVQFESLARSLARVTADNHMLIDRLISLQEAERKEIAHGLHDEFGPSLFGIRAAVACIETACAADPVDLSEIRDSTAMIADLTDRIQRINYRMLDRLRPLVLDQMGLEEALRQLIDDWRDRYPSLDWSLDMRCDAGITDERARLTLYRVVQECLTNIARHAGATAATVALDRASVDPGGRDCLHVTVADDDGGFPPDLHFGFGLLGITERVRALGGRLQISNAGAGGASVQVRMPIEPALSVSAA
jgi:two-component system sensor histidine kinase UhpB